MKRIIVTLTFGWLFVFFLSAQVSTKVVETFERAAALNRPVLLVFSGSDWCLPCIRFHKQILADSVFQKFAAQNLLVLNADFPQTKKLSKELLAQNEKLAEQYNPTGAFPYIVLLNPDGTLISAVNYNNESATGFIELLKGQIKRGNYPREFYASGTLMSSPFEFTVVDTNTEHGWQMIRESIAEVKRIEHLISEWIDTTQVSRLNQLAGKEPMRTDCELYQLIQRSIEISKITQGAFDISFLGAGKLWKFDGSMKQLPDPTDVAKAVEHVGYDKIQLLDSCRVFLTEVGMRIGFGGNGQGYAVDCVKKLLQGKGVQSAIINMSGDIYAWGKRPDGSPWKVGIANPADKENPRDAAQMLLWLPLEDAAVTTCGNYEKYTDINGVRYSHVINPRTGYPAQGIKSVTVVSSSTELSDALDTGIFVLGLEAGLNLVNQLPGVNCMIVDEENKIHYSKNMQVNKPSANTPSANPNH